MTGTALLSLLGAVLVASVIGSAHCAGMCGGLALFAVNHDGSLRRSWRLHMSYHLGRGVSYTLIGAAAGLTGAAVDFASLSAGWQRPAAAAAGSAMVVIGLFSLAMHCGARVKRLRGPAWYQRLVEGVHRAALALPGATRAWGIGLLTPLLPCGWLYVFAIAAAGTGSPFVGALVMAAFWAGTLPLMGSLGLGLSVLTGPLRRRVPLVTAGLVMVLGVLTATGRLCLPTFTPARDLAAGPVAVRASIEAVRGLDHRAAPCCNPESEAVAEPGS